MASPVVVVSLQGFVNKLISGSHDFDFEFDFSDVGRLVRTSHKKSPI